MYFNQNRNRKIHRSQEQCTYALSRESMPANPRNTSPADGVEEVMRRLKVEGSDENGGASNGYPDRPGQPDCIYYLRTGSCGYGSDCRFNHPADGGVGQVRGDKSISELPERAGQPDCVYYLKTGTCKYGSVCKYHHPKDKLPDEVVMNAMGLPMRQDAKSCPYYMRTGSCKYGPGCKFHHPQPAVGGNMLPVVGSVYGSGGSTAVPSSGATSVGELSAAPLSKATYFGGSLQLPQSYMPLYMSPSQGWNAYMGGVSPLSVASVLTSPATNGQLSDSYLPERPDQPECRYFMNHGSCKYGSECRYHHPREKLSQLASGSISPLGLPLRPGHPVCSHYTLHGLCKFGPTCRFDHPLDGYHYAPYSLGVSPLASSFPVPSAPNPRMPLPPPPLQAPSSDPKLSKLSDGVSKGPTTSNNKDQLSNTREDGDSSDPLLPLPSEPSSETIHNPSD